MTDLLFAILAANAYTELYQQQESIYFALYAEVTVAKSLLEQLTLIGQGRPWYGLAPTGFVLTRSSGEAHTHTHKTHRLGWFLLTPCSIQRPAWHTGTARPSNA